MVQRVATYLGSLTAEVDDAWRGKVALARRTFGMGPEQWAGDAGEPLYPADPELRRRITEEIDGPRRTFGNPERPVEERYRDFLAIRPSDDQRATLRSLLLSLSVLETELRAYFGRSSAVLTSFQRARRALTAQVYFLTGDLGPQIREEFSDLLDGAADGGPAAFTRLGEVVEESRVRLVDLLLTEHIRLG